MRCNIHNDSDFFLLLKVLKAITLKDYHATHHIEVGGVIADFKEESIPENL